MNELTLRRRPDGHLLILVRQRELSPPGVPLPGEISGVVTTISPHATVPRPRVSAGKRRQPTPATTPAQTTAGELPPHTGCPFARRQHSAGAWVEWSSSSASRAPPCYCSLAIERICSSLYFPAISGCAVARCTFTCSTTTSSVSPSMRSPHGQLTTFTMPPIVTLFAPQARLPERP
jgi:hypothetical protein